MSLLITIRALAIALIILLVDYFQPLGTSPLVLALTGTVGVVVAGLCSQTKLKTLGFLTGLGILAVGIKILLKLGELIFLPFFSDPLVLHSLQLHLGFCLVAFFAGAISTWAVMRSIHGLSAEVLVVVSGAIYFFSGHRDFNFHSPQILGTIAWSLGYSPLAVLTAIGVLLMALSLIYFRLCSGLHEQRLKLTQHRGAGNREVQVKTLISTFCILGLFYLIGNAIFARYQVEAEIRTSNGVGQGREESQSPLGFNSALGASNQPAALVRLDSDYSDNPFVPMLYLRESALSEYNGKELVAADSRYDQETANIAPDSHFKALKISDWEYRTPLVQSVFLLNDHKLAFSVDFPMAINPLKNPNPDRFKGSYKAYSMAPGFSQDSLRKLEVGDPTWEEETRAHYLKTNPDPRYAELAKKLSVDLNSPIEKAFALTDFLTTKAIYTLSPGHEVPENGDQTAPFLFGDMRGYCVHFAHALTYLFRSLGIPARVGTGYLTDLSQARDGHILLRMSDRHAWAEVYVHERGWVPFDPKPQQVESHAESPVDMKLLEELMDLVGPDEEILPPDLAAGEVGLEEPSSFNLPGASALLWTLMVSFTAMLLLKIHLWFSWVLPSSPQTKLKRLYRALTARVNDIGFSRFEGETREEYRSRVSNKLGQDLLSLTHPLNQLVYAQSAPSNDVVNLYKEDIVKLNKIPLLQKIKAGISPNSLIRYCSRGAW